MKTFIGLFVLLSMLCMTSISFAATITLTWAANTESDLDGYKVYRGTGACATGPLQPLMVNGVHVKVAKPAVTYVDNTVPSLDGDVCYEITAIDTSGNESPKSNRAIKAVNSVPPMAPKNLTISEIRP